MDWIDLYVYEAIRHVPRANRPKAESELRQTIAERLPNDPTESEIKQVLADLGDPVYYAGTFSGRKSYLIGPVLFPKYVALLKILVPVVLLVMTFTLLFAEFMTYSGPLLPAIRSFTASLFEVLWNVGIQLVFFVTLVFFLIERFAGEEFDTKHPWKVERLRSTQKSFKENRIPKWSIIVGLIWTITWFMIYLNSARLNRVVESTNDGFRTVSPIFNQSFLDSLLYFVLLLVACEVGMAVYKWIKGHWTYPLATVNLLYNVLFSTLLILFLTSDRLFDQRFTDLLASNSGLGETIFRIPIMTIIFITVTVAALDSWDGFRRAAKRSDRGHHVSFT
ncbi:hypothetical protein [Exiguobacterium flavidum]|uniref:hypothetical protein n=1 Tax=Exiguobacterium flavidum TaxID=2184695 RepID=UPI000DF7FA69|nr:hypothetical protein [Exiguobacterium flavidum]